MEDLEYSKRSVGWQPAEAEGATMRVPFRG
jgi:hypothetical protein